MIEKMLDGIDVCLNEDYLQQKELYNSKAKKIIYTGSIDEYYSYCFGPLQYRCVRFEHEMLQQENYQGNAVVNYTDSDTPWTRIIEHKWFEFGRDEQGETLPNTVISREYSTEWKLGDEPYYPINDEKNLNLYQQYDALAKQEKKIIFGGRLGAYKYYDMDQVILEALRLSDIELCNS